MNYLIKLIILTLGGLITNIAISETLAIDAQERGINSTCADGVFTILTPPDNSYQLILTVTGENGCMMTETRMLWPGR